MVDGSVKEVQKASKRVGVKAADKAREGESEWEWERDQAKKVAASEKRCYVGKWEL